MPNMSKNDAAAFGRIARDFGLGLAIILVVFALLGLDAAAINGTFDPLGITSANASAASLEHADAAAANRLAAMALSSFLFASIVAFNLWFVRRVRARPVGSQASRRTTGPVRDQAR